MEIIVLTIGSAIVSILIPFYSNPIIGLAGIIIGGVVGVSVVRITMKGVEIETWGRFWPIVQLAGGVMMGVLAGFIIKS